MRLQIIALVISLVGANVGITASARSNTSLETLARKAVSEDSVESPAAIDELRSRGPAGLQALLDAYAEELTAARAGARTASGQWQRLRTALDRVSSQRDSYASGLYWYTDLPQAQAAAKASGKPILSLRLLGRLDEDLSCANSRFFRTTLYSNAEVSRFLREHFILHWESVRPVPKVTIDFGDGRKIERTLTGNSIHYVLDVEGRPVDALPGLYGPRAFLQGVARAEQAATNCARARTPLEREGVLRAYHTARIQELANDWAGDVAKARLASPPSRDAGNRRVTSAPPTAEQAVRGAITKMMVVEKPILRGISSSPRALETTADDVAWAKIGALYSEDARLDPGSRALIRSKNPVAYADRGTFERVIANLERAIAEDTARNKYVFESKLHEWFVAGALTKDVRMLNERVYSELFLTPSSDPWLGLLPRDSFTAIENDGIRK